jgi:hypothetical protein
MLLNETAPVWEMAFHSSMQYFCKMLQHFVDHKCSAARNFTPNFSLVFTVCHCELPAVQVLTDLGITPDAMPLALITSNEHESVSWFADKKFVSRSTYSSIDSAGLGQSVT